jgi:two-component system LytT family response regulator
MQRATLREWERNLPSSMFRRIHRSSIVNLDRIDELRPLDHGEYMLVLTNGDEVRLSRGYSTVADLLLRRGD